MPRSYLSSRDRKQPWRVRMTSYVPESRLELRGAIHRVQVLWDENLSTGEKIFLLIYAKNAFNEINLVGMLVLFSTAIVTGHQSFFRTSMGRQVFYIVERA